MPDAGVNRWGQPKVILVATDLTDLDRLMPFTFQQAHQSNARIILIHVLGSGASVAADPAGMPYYDPAVAIDSAIRILEPWRTKGRAQELACDILIREGSPAQQIIATARQFKADRLLLGTRSRSKVSRLLLGSVAEQVLRSVDLPVITVGPEAHLKVDDGARQRVVLHATTLRETSSLSAALACQIASSHRAKLVLLHVLLPVDEMRREHLPDCMNSTALKKLRALAAEAEASESCCAQVDTRVSHGHPAIEILAASVELKADLIVLGSTNRSVLHSLTHDRTVYRVLAHAHCPVMTLRDADEEIDPVPPEHDKISI